MPKPSAHSRPRFADPTESFVKHSRSASRSTTARGTVRLERWDGADIDGCGTGTVIAKPKSGALMGSVPLISIRASPSSTASRRRPAYNVDPGPGDFNYDSKYFKPQRSTPIPSARRFDYGNTMAEIEAVAASHRRRRGSPGTTHHGRSYDDTRRRISDEVEDSVRERNSADVASVTAQLEHLIVEQRQHKQEAILCGGRAAGLLVEWPGNVTPSRAQLLSVDITPTKSESAAAKQESGEEVQDVVVKLGEEVVRQQSSVTAKRAPTCTTPTPRSRKNSTDGGPGRSGAAARRRSSGSRTPSQQSKSLVMQARPVRSGQQATRRRSEDDDAEYTATKKKTVTRSDLAFHAGFTNRAQDMAGTTGRSNLGEVAGRNSSKGADRSGTPSNRRLVAADGTSCDLLAALQAARRRQRIDGENSTDLTVRTINFESGSAAMPLQKQESSKSSAMTRRQIGKVPDSKLSDREWVTPGPGEYIGADVAYSSTARPLSPATHRRGRSTSPSYSFGRADRRCTPTINRVNAGAVAGSRR